jgi:hypothetical protein
MRILVAVLFVAVVAVVIAPTVDIPAAIPNSGNAGRLLAALVCALVIVATDIVFVTSRKGPRSDSLVPSYIFDPLTISGPLLC